MIAFSVFTIAALTFLCALQTRTKALTVFLPAMRFFASAPPCRHKCWNSLKKPWISIICYFFCLINLLTVLRLVSTANTNAVLITKASSRKTFAVQFETIYFCAFASLVIIVIVVLFSLCINGIKVGNLRETVWRIS